MWTRGQSAQMRVYGLALGFDPSRFASETSIFRWGNLPKQFDKLS